MTMFNISGRLSKTISLLSKKNWSHTTHRSKDIDKKPARFEKKLVWNYFPLYHCRCMLQYHVNLHQTWIELCKTFVFFNEHICCVRLTRIKTKLSLRKMRRIIWVSIYFKTCRSSMLILYFCLRVLKKQGNVILGRFLALFGSVKKPANQNPKTSTFANLEIYQIQISL